MDQNLFAINKQSQAVHNNSKIENDNSISFKRIFEMLSFNVQ